MTLPENKNIGESWEVSAHPNGMSIVENGPLAGKTLQEFRTKTQIRFDGRLQN